MSAQRWLDNVTDRLYAEGSGARSEIWYMNLPEMLVALFLRVCVFVPWPNVLFQARLPAVALKQWLAVSNAASSVTASYPVV